MSLNLDKEKSFISFYVNGQEHIVKDEFPLSTSLSYYLRNVLQLTGTKVLCHEGGCGCCVVSASVFDTQANQYKEISVNSCLFPLYSCDGYMFTTVEGLGNKSTGLHPIQKRLADNNGSQCGYCTPGFIMNIYSTLKSNPQPSKEEIERSLDGNLCRCTGYRAILDTMKSFAKDEQPIDIEELCNLKCLNKSTCCSKNNTSHHAPHHLNINGIEWFTPNNLNELNKFLAQLKHNNFRFIYGNTSIGIYKNDGPFNSYINIKNMSELYNIEMTENNLTIGSNITLTQLINTFKDLSAKHKSKYGHLNELANGLIKVGNVNVRNMASWAGNLALKKQHLEFPSDVLVILEAAGAKLKIFNLINNTYLDNMSLNEFLTSDTLKPNGYLIESMCLPIYDQDKVKLKYFKVSPRSQNAHSYVNCVFRFEFESYNSTKLNGIPLIAYNGITSKFYFANETQNFMNGKDISDSLVLNEAIDILSKEINESGLFSDAQDAILASSAYRSSLAISLFYKFLLELNKNTIKDELKSGLDSVVDCRSVSHAEYKFERKESSYPVCQPLPKINAYHQVSGETKYIDDLAPLAHQTHGAFILSKVARAKIESIDIEKAMSLKGVIRVLLAKDIPGSNSIMPKPFDVEPLFADKEILYCGQPIGLVIADTHETAKRAARIVEVKYADVKKPILDIFDAIKENSYHPKPSCGDLIKGDVATAIKDSKHNLSGELYFDCSQFNFFIEGIIGTCEPNEDGYKIECTTQWIDCVQRGVANVLGIDNSSCIDVQVKQLGGGFGGKITRGNIVATASAVAAYHLRRPVKIHMDLNDCMDMVGKRPSWYVKYNVGFDENGKLNGLDMDWYSDPGFSPNGSYVFFAINFFDNVYKCDNYLIKPIVVNTNKPASTEVRSPDVLSSYSATEQIIEHIAHYLNKDPLEVRQVNFFSNGDKTAQGHLLTNIDTHNIVNNLLKDCEYHKRKQEIEQFNKLNKYKKRGISVMPLRYAMTYELGYYNALVSVRHSDGSVAVSHGGIEMGQGLSTKVAQVCAHELGIPLEKVSVKSTNNLVNPNALWTGASVTSELCCRSVIEACKVLKQKLEPAKAVMNENYTWSELIAKAFSMNCDLTAMFLQRPNENIKDLMTYDVEAAACSEVLIDVLTGETQILRSDILYDCGQTINGLIDLGQVEGGFIMGLGYMLLERTVYDPETGKCLSNGTWEYKIPTTKDIPMDLRVKFVENKPNPHGVMGSKATAEPPLGLANSILNAIRHAIVSARKEQGENSYFRLDIPASVDSVQQACLINSKEFKF